MKKIFYAVVSLVAVCMTISSCDEYESYAEKRDYELSRLSSFIDNPTFGEIKGKKISVISESEFLKDTVTDLSKNEFVKFGNGLYMQIVRRGCGSVIKDGESASVICRFKEYNINATEDNLQSQLRNDNPFTLQDYYEKFDVRKNLGTFSASWSVREDGTYHGVMPNSYFTVNVFGQITGPTNVPEGWIVPLSYIKLGRIANENDELAKVRLIVPHSMGHTESNDRIYACYYEITYERGI